jgi:hypothetical protein
MSVLQIIPTNNQCCVQRIEIQINNGRLSQTDRHNILCVANQNAFSLWVHSWHAAYRVSRLHKLPSKWNTNNKAACRTSNYATCLTRQPAGVHQMVQSLL